MGILLTLYSVHKSVQHSVMNRQIGLEGIIHQIGDVLGNANRPWRGHRPGHLGQNNYIGGGPGNIEDYNGNSNSNANTNTASQSSSNANGKN